ncbi:tyrosine--tRNA ligase [Bombilactobacillus mellis]|uniref:tyrosine--tRNA ligase n=1 Tax=Bombilactobacillus mellis TaxID=1218508 RepID=UPI00224650F0|nr:tyrosine--tRNA ligase [Bombilactobacillus mellis]MCX0278834.1 tyrosine--tRNA ligase [Bombilactobacillus mellis]
MDILEDLQWRQAIQQISDESNLKRLLASGKKISLYCGVDPTGDSLHIGHLIPFIMLKRFQQAGHHPYIVIGGGTGSIGDPSGRKTERQLQTMDQVNRNKAALTQQMRRIFGQDNFTIVDNYDWLSKISLLDFLRDYGKLFNVNTMLNKEIVARRLEAGISFTEFTYQILQSVDFWHLFKHEQVQVQIGGADQWGNLTAGMDLIHKKQPQAEVFALTIPLMLKADGTKFGKTAGGAVWLDPKKTSPFEFYQFWLNQDDRDVIKYLKFFTFLSHEEIDQLAVEVAHHPEKRAAQRRLAQEVTTFVHGKAAMQEAEKISQILFGGDIKDLSVAQIEQAFAKMPSVQASAQPQNIINWLVDLKLEPSKRQAREDVQNGAISLNGNLVTDEQLLVQPDEHFDGKYMIVRKGKKNYTLVHIKND